MRQIKSGWAPALFMVLGLFAAGCQNNVVPPPDEHGGDEPEASVVQDAAGGYFLQFRLSYANNRTIDKETARKVLRNIYEITVLDKAKYTPPEYKTREYTVYGDYSDFTADSTPPKYGTFPHYDGVPDTRIVSGEELVKIPIEIGKTYKVLILAGHKASRTLLGAWYGDIGPVTAGINTVIMTGGYMPTMSVSVWKYRSDRVTQNGDIEHYFSNGWVSPVELEPGESFYRMKLGNSYYIVMNPWPCDPKNRYLNGDAHAALRKAEDASLIYPYPTYSTGALFRIQNFLNWMPKDMDRPLPKEPLFTLQSPLTVELKPDSTPPPLRDGFCNVLQYYLPAVLYSGAEGVYASGLEWEWLSSPSCLVIFEDSDKGNSYPPLGSQLIPQWEFEDDPRPMSIHLGLYPPSSSLAYPEGTEWDCVLSWHAGYRPFGLAGGENWIIRRGINDTPEWDPKGNVDSAGGGIRLKIIQGGP